MCALGSGGECSSSFKTNRAPLDHTLMRPGEEVPMQIKQRVLMSFTLFIPGHGASNKQVMFIRNTRLSAEDGIVLQMLIITFCFSLLARLTDRYPDHAPLCVETPDSFLWIER